MSKHDSSFGQRGDLPDFNDLTVSNTEYAMLYHAAIGYARHEFNNAELKQHAKTWCELNDHDWDWYEAAPDWKFLSVGKIAWVSNNGGELTEQTQDWFDKELRKIRQTVSHQTEEPDIELTSRQRQTIQYVNMYSRIDQIWWHNRQTLDLIQTKLDQLIRQTQPSTNLLKKLYKHYHEDYMLAVKSLANPTVSETVMPLMIVNNVLAARTGNATVAGRKTQSLKTQKKASQVKSKQLDVEWGLVGVDPGQIVGAKTALVFNTKNRILWYYESETGLDLSTSNISGFDPELSWGKTIRKPREMLTETNLSSAKRAKIVFADYVKGKAHQPTGRLNSDCILIKVF